MTQIAILGLGAMGSRMARTLLNAGHQVRVYNRSAAAAETLVALGAHPAASPRDAAQGAEVVISMVTDDLASRAVWLDGEHGAVHGLEAGTLAIESSTLTPGWITRLSTALSERGASFLDAPVVGSRPQAEAGQLVYLVGGEGQDFERVEPLLKSMAAAVHHVGPLGQGTVLKLVVNALFGIQVAALGELLGLLRKSGVDDVRAVDILGGLPVLSPALKGAAGLMLARNFAPQFPIDLVEKDFRYVLEAAQEVQSELPTTQAVGQVYQRARAEGHGSENIAGVVQLFEEWRSEGDVKSLL